MGTEPSLVGPSGGTEVPLDEPQPPFSSGDFTNRQIFSGGSGCVDIDECVSDDFNECIEPSSFCDNNEGGYDCICSNGFEENDVDGVNTCTDIDECARETHSCHEWAECVNTEPGYECLCQSGKG